MPRRFLITAILFLIAGAFITPLQRDLFVGDETKYGQVVREMRATGAFFLPTLNGTPFTHKPPIHFWMIDLLTFPLGVYSTWAFVLPSLIAFVFLLWLMWKIGGPLAAFICGSSLMIWASAQSARMDVSFTAFIVLALWQLERFFDRDDFRALLWSAIAIGIAVLIKGPMAPVIAIVLFVLEWMRRKRIPDGNYAPAVLAMIVIPLLWLVPAMLLGGRAYTHDVIVKQTFGRAVASWVHNAPPWFYVIHLPASLFPWFFLAVAAVIAQADSRRAHERPDFAKVGTFVVFGRMQHRKEEQSGDAPEGDVPGRSFTSEEGEIVDGEVSVAAELIDLDRGRGPEDRQGEQSDERRGRDAAFSVDRHRTTFRSCARSRPSGSGTATARFRRRARALSRSRSASSAPACMAWRT